MLSPEEVRRFLDAAQGGDGLHRLMVCLLYGTGMRRQRTGIWLDLMSRGYLRG